MGGFFKGWRRKIGVLTLLVACVFAAGWVRGIATQDLFLVGNGQRVVNTGSVLVLLSSSARDGIVWARYEIAGNMSWLSGWQSRSTKDEDYFHPLEIGENVMKPDFMDSHRRFIGIDTGLYRHEKFDASGNSETFSFFRISYSSIVIPLTLLSACLLLGKLRADKRSTD